MNADTHFVISPKNQTGSNASHRSRSHKTIQKPNQYMLYAPDSLAGDIDLRYRQCEIPLPVCPKTAIFAQCVRWWFFLTGKY